MVVERRAEAVQTGDAAEPPLTKLPAIDSCSVSLLEWLRPALRAFNDTTHLAALAPPVTRDEPV